MSRMVNILGDGSWSLDKVLGVPVMGIVMVEGRECAMREDGLRGYSSRKGPKPVTRTLISSGDSSESMLEVEMLDSEYLSESEFGLGERGGGGGGDGGMMISRHKLPVK